MASRPGILTEWPWTPLGNFKYIVLAPWAVQGTYQFLAKDGERDLGHFLIFPFLLVRMLHNQIWISLSRYRTAKGNNRIIDKGIEFDQVDRERNWDDQIIFNGILFYLGFMTLPGASHMPFWRADGVIITALLHTGPVEFLYYWLHRALHHHFLYTRYHSHHHSSIVTEPITSVIHPFAEHLSYFTLFAIPLLTTMFTGTSSIVSFAGYVSYIDFMNNMGHCNFELVPKWVFSIFPPLKYFMYTPTYHSLHHTQFRTNYSLFMPIYDYIYGTTDKSSDSLYEEALQREEEQADVVHLTHLTTPESIYHLRLGFASLAAKPHSSKSSWYLWMMWPVTIGSVLFTWLYGHPFVLERNSFKKLNLQSWVIPRFYVQYLLPWRREAISGLIEEAILDADKKGVKVLSLGLLNQGEELNRNGELYIRKHSSLSIKLVDGSSLAAAVVINSIPSGTTKILLGGKLTNVAFAIANALCRRGIMVCSASNDELDKLKSGVDSNFQNNLVLLTDYSPKIWIVGEAMAVAEQSRASPGTLFIPCSQFPPQQTRNDCFNHKTPAMIIPPSFKNMDSCENWLPRRVMSAWRVAGIVHAIEGWKEHECGQDMLDIDKVWEAALRHGFQPLPISKLHNK